MREFEVAIRVVDNIQAASTISGAIQFVGEENRTCLLCGLKFVLNGHIYRVEIDWPA